MARSARIVLRSKDEVSRARCDGDRSREYRIKGVTGLLLEIQPTGTASYVLRYVAKEGSRRRFRRMTLGRRTRYAEELSSIKERAIDLLAEISRGSDPSITAKCRRQAITLQELAERRLATDETLSDNTREHYRQIFQANVFPEFGHLPADDLSNDMVHAITQPIAQRGARVQADRTVAAIGGLFRWGASARGGRLVKHNPAKGIGRHAISQPREHVLNDGQLAAVWRAVSSVHYTEGLALATKIALYTGLRRSEVIMMQWDELDFENGLLIMRGSRTRKGRLQRGRTKNQREHVVPLPRQVIALLRRARELASQSEYVFPARDADCKFPHLDPRSASRALRRVRARFGITEATMHDFRRTVASWLGETDTDLLTIKRALNHAPSGVTERHYLHSPRVQQVREALQRWADYLDHVVAGDTAEPTEMREKSPGEVTSPIEPVAQL